MREIFNTAVYMTLGYLVGLWLAAPGLFSTTLAMTQWGNIVTWAYLLFWPFILIFHFALWIIAVIAVFALVYWLIMKFA